MQAWMLRGRQLSSEMEQRITGASLGRGRQQSGPSDRPLGSRDPCTRHVSVNHITVSKKRNWLQQSSPRPFPPPEDEEERPLTSRELRLPLQRPRPPDEENDADDEGDIWYNPIPEEEEPQRRWGGAGPEGGATEDDTTPPHSSDAAQLHRQMLPCRTPEEHLNAKATDAPSPASSPNPAKKGAALPWPFPDKIKSPRTVRKLSMKMKKLPDLSRRLGGRGTVTGALASGNVIWHYHLDSSVSSPHSFDKRRSNCGGVPKSASKGGYLSDGDSPELVAKSGKHGGGAEGGSGKAHKLSGLDVDAFRPYSFSEQPKCLAYISGLMSLHFYGAEDLKPPRADARNVYCAIQVDAVNKARTALLTCRAPFLDMDHTFNIQLENAQHLKLVVFSWEATPGRNRVCCHGSVVLPALFRVGKTHQLAVRLEPRGMIYVKLGLMERRHNSPDGWAGQQEPRVFGVEAWRLVEREASGLVVPLLIHKCVAEIERRGCQVVGLYRLCGSAAVKKELREAFEKDSHGVQLSENNFPDINVITGVLKDYLRELPHPLVPKQLYESVLEVMVKRPLLMGPSGCENDPADTEHALALLEVLPEVEKATLRKLLDHLKRVASHHEVNKMTCQNLAVCFGPVLLSQRQEASCHGNRVFIDSEELASALHFKKHIEVLHYLLQIWPVADAQGKASSAVETLPAVRRRKERPQVLNLSEVDMAGVLRPKTGRLDSPSNRYAGDWSRCKEAYLQPSCPEESGAEEPPQASGDRAVQQVDEGMERDEETQPEEETARDVDSVLDLDGLETLQLEEPCDEILLDHGSRRTYQAYVKIQEISPVLSNRVNLRDLQESIDALIGNLERELNKNKLNIGY